MIRSPWGRWLSTLAALGSILVAWQLAALFLPEFLMPGVIRTFARLGDSVVDHDWLDGLIQSLYRLAVGYPVACLLGTLLGLLAGLSRSFAAYLRSLISVLQSVPPITWVPFLLIFLGFGNMTIIAVIAIAAFFPMALSVMNATEGTNRTHLELARVMGASRLQLLSKVYLPEALPAVITGAQVAFGIAFRSLIAAEMVGGARAGLGWSIHYSGEIADMRGVLAGIIVIGTIAAFLDQVVLEIIKRRLLRWRYVSGGGE